MHAWKAFNMKQRRHTNCSNLYWLYFNYEMGESVFFLL